VADKDQDKIKIPGQEATVAFRAEMFFQNVVLGYWQYGVGLVVVVLLGFFLYGTYSTITERNQQAGTGACAAVIAKMQTKTPGKLLPGDELFVPYDVPWDLLVTQGDPTTLVFDKVSDEQKTKLDSYAKQLEQVADENGGVASRECRLYAAELYRITGNGEGRKKALETVASAGGTIGFAAAENLAAIEIAGGSFDSGAARLRTQMDSQQGYLAERAALDLGRNFEIAGKKDDAVKLYAEFVEKWPKSARVPEVQSRQRKLGVTPSVPKPTEGATEGTPEKPEGAEDAG
jgi:hypothetical protein